MTEQQQKVNTLIERIEKHQQALRLSDVRFVGRYQRFLGSTKTWRDRLIGRAWGEMGRSLEKWEQRLSAFVSEIDGGADLSEMMPELPIARYGLAVFDALQGQRSDRRVAWLIGPTGVGKSWTMRWLAHENPTTTAYLHIAPRGRKESFTGLACALAKALGVTEESGGAATFRNVQEALKGNAMTLIVDDVHEGGVLMLKLVKHLIDDTRAKFVLGTYPTAWNALVNGSTDAHAEAQQLLGRSLKPINRTWIAGATEADVAAYLKLTLGGNGECRVLAERIAPMLRKNGNLRALADALELARMNDDEAEVTADLVEAAVRELCPGKS